MIKLIKKDLLLQKRIIYITIFFFILLQLMMMLLVLLQKEDPWTFIEFLGIYHLKDMFTYIVFVSVLLNVIFCFLLFNKENNALLFSFPFQKQIIFKSKMFLATGYTVLVQGLAITVIIILMSLFDYAKLTSKVLSYTFLENGFMVYLWITLILNMTINFAITLKKTERLNLDRKMMIRIPLISSYFLIVFILFYLFSQLFQLLISSSNLYLILVISMLIINMILYFISRYLFMRIDV